jgi:hypothetical protein
MLEDGLDDVQKGEAMMLGGGFKDDGGGEEVPDIGRKGLGDVMVEGDVRTYKLLVLGSGLLDAGEVAGD